MSTWRMWCVDGDDKRLNSEETDIFFTWRWVDRWTLEAVLPTEEAMLITVKYGTLTHFHCECTTKPGRVLLASLDWDRPVRWKDSVISNDLRLTLDEGAILLMEEYLPLRPAA